VIPQVRYAKSSDGVHIAYQVIGEGPVDVVWPGHAYSNIEYAWRIPNLRRFLRKIGSIGRLIVLDPRGQGLSDKVGVQMMTFEGQMGDVLAVLDGVGSDRAALLGTDQTGPLAILFAATYPERTSALIVYASYARGTWAPDYPEGWSEERWDSYLEELERRWGQPDYIREFYGGMAPSLSIDDELLETLTTFYRITGGPGTALALDTLERDTDIRHVLPAVHVPTLILHRTDDPMYSIGEGRYLAEHIPGARFAELAGGDHTPWDGDSDSVVSEIGHFLRSVRDEESELERVLATVMVTDIVGSTGRASALGDHAWKELLASHHDIVRHLLARYRGREVDTAGDGFLATFDGPARAVRCALAITSAVRELDIDVRIGLHTGEIELEGDAVRGMAVHIGARVSALAEPAQVLVSSTVKDLVAGSGIAFEDRGISELKGIPGEWHLFAVAADEVSPHPAGSA
jgi:class 3 adenylate cyclase